MRSARWRTALAVGISASFLLAACGSDDKSSDTTAAPTTAGAATTAAAATTAGGAATTAAAATTHDRGGGDHHRRHHRVDGGWQRRRRADRSGQQEPAALRRRSGRRRVQGHVRVRDRPAKLCPTDWDPKQGITDSEIRLFTSLPTSGPLAGFGLLADGAKVYFDYINANGGIEGRNIIVDTKDDAYKPDQTKTNVDEALQSKKYAGLYVTLGTPNNLAVWDETNDECMPQLLNGTGAAQWGDVDGHPWTTGMQLDYFTEAGMWAKWLETEHPDKKKVAELTFNSDFGQSYHNGFAFAIEGTDLKVVDQENHEPTAREPGQPVHHAGGLGRRRAVAGDLRRVLHAGDGQPGEADLWKPLVIMSGTCASLNQFFKPLIDQGLTGAGTNLILNYKDVNDPANANRSDGSALPEDDDRGRVSTRRSRPTGPAGSSPGTWSTS